MSSGARSRRTSILLIVAGVALGVTVAVLVGYETYPAPPDGEKALWHQVLKHFLLWSQAIGIPIAIVLFVIEKRNERRDREYGTYDSLDDKYLQYLATCLAHPHLDVFDLPLEGEHERELTRQELIIYTTLVAILERAFLLYDDKSETVRERQWTGWSQYIDAWVSRPKFQRAWAVIGSQFEERFTREVNERLRAHDAHAAMTHAIAQHPDGLRRSESAA